MLNIDVCLETVFPHLPIEARIGKIAEAGYQYAEFWLHEGKDAAALRQAATAAGVTINNLVVNPPDDSVAGAPNNAADLHRYLERVRGSHRLR